MKKLTNAEFNNLFDEDKEEYLKKWEEFKRAEKKRKYKAKAGWRRKREREWKEHRRKYFKRYFAAKKELTKVLKKRIKDLTKPILRREKRKQETEERRRLKKEKIALEKEERIAKHSQRLIVEFIARYGEDTFYEYKRTGFVPSHVSVTDKTIILKIFEGEKKDFTSYTIIEPLAWKDYDLEILSEIANFGNIEKIRNKNRPIYVCNGVYFVCSKLHCVRRKILASVNTRNIIDCLVGKFENEFLVYRVKENRKNRMIFYKNELVSLEEVFDKENQTKEF
jgi:hypothetical protein